MGFPKIKGKHRDVLDKILFSVGYIVTGVFTLSLDFLGVFPGPLGILIGLILIWVGLNPDIYCKDSESEWG